MAIAFLATQRIGFAALVENNVSAPFTNLDLLQVARNPRVNYLHTGKVLDVLSEFLRKGDETKWPNNAVLRQLGLHLTGSSELTRLVRGYQRSKKRMKFAELQKELRESVKWRNRFRALGCRGFSYVMDFQMKGYNAQQPCQFRLAPFVNLRLALMPGEHLFYPTRVKQYFRQVISPGNHYFQKKMPSIAICLGKKTEEAWYVFVMQSDLASNGLSCVREHFRGWRNILFANVVAQAQGKVRTLYLSRARDVERACYPGTKEVGCAPEPWKSIYDHTAEQWGMRLVKLSEPVDVQIYRSQQSVYSEHFFKLSLSE